MSSFCAITQLTGFTLQWLMQLLSNITISGQMRREWIGLVLLPLLRGNVFGMTF